MQHNFDNVDAHVKGDVSAAAPKRLNKLTISLTDSDIEGLDACIGLFPMFPPARCTFLCLIVREGLARILEGESRPLDIYQKFGKRDLSEVLTRYLEASNN